MPESSAPIRIVLIETSHPGNIGATGRAMKNMSLEQLYLVRPHHFPHADATARAAGADNLLSSAVVCDTLEEAVAGCSLVFGASARIRSLRWPQVDARECGSLAVEHSRQGGEVALVFGRERSGLTNQELALCNYLTHIPSNEAFSSLNVAAAVQLLCYEVMMATRGDQVEQVVTPTDPEEAPARSGELEGLYQHLEKTLIEVGFLYPDNPGQLMRRLRRLYNRAALNHKEVNILRGMLTAIEKRIRDGL